MRNAKPHASLLTAVAIRLGRTVARLVFRADMGRLGEWTQAPEPDAEIVVAWIRVLVRNFELLIAWLVLWVLLHVGAIVVAGTVLGPGHGGPVSLLIPVEVLPGFFVGLSVARLTLATVQMPRVGRDAHAGASGMGKCSGVAIGGRDDQ